MTTDLLIYCAALFVGTFIAALGYRRLWTGRAAGHVPTGFGALLAASLLGAALWHSPVTGLAGPLTVIALATAVYWWDDFSGLSAQFRLLLSFIAGLLIAITLLGPQPENLTAILLISALFSGIMCVFLTNMINFYDGADLNLATFILLTAIIILFFTPVNSAFFALAIAMLAYIVPFSILNSRPQTIYLGDSGSFAFAAFATLMAMSFLYGLPDIPPEAAIPAALPALDVFYVFAVRIRERHDLLTRNYMHLYQRLNRRYRGFGYLLPQLANALFCLGFAASLQAFGMARIPAVVLAMATVTPPFYTLCRHLFLNGPLEGPLHEERR